MLYKKLEMETFKETQEAEKKKRPGTQKETYALLFKTHTWPQTKLFQRVSAEDACGTNSSPTGVGLLGCGIFVLRLCISETGPQILRFQVGTPQKKKKKKVLEKL